jgi:hypothetical protein
VSVKDVLVHQLSHFPAGGALDREAEQDVARIAVATALAGCELRRQVVDDLGNFSFLPVVLRKHLDQFGRQLEQDLHVVRQPAGMCQQVADGDRL